jgi:hypothetical protein
MTRRVPHPATRPFRLSQSAIEAHERHAPTPFFGCALCIRRTPMKALDIRWTSPRHA